MNNFVFCSPTYFVFGKESESKAGEYVKKYNGSKVLIHYGGKSAEKSGLLDRVKSSLDEYGIEYIMLGGVQPNPRSGLIYEGIDICKKKNVDFILAVGGGSVIDSAKAIACGSRYDGDFWDFYDGVCLPTDAIPLGTILTIAAAGSEGSGDSVVTHENGMLKQATTGDCLRPKFSILNPELTQTLPAYQTACGATDTMAHVFERYISNTTEVEITDRLCEAVLLTMLKETPRVIEDPNNYEARANIMWAGMVAHNNVVGVGREQDWNSHDIEHQLSAVYDCAHGAGLAVIMPAWMTYVVDQNVMRFAQMAVRIFGCEMNFANPKATALEGIARFRAFLKSIGMPINFEELGAKREDIPVFIEKFGIGDGKTGGFVKLDKNDIAAIYEIAANQPSI